MVKVIYWTGTGNTGNMATYIAEGLKQANLEVEVKEVGDASVAEAVEADLLVLGCPSMGAEELEEGEMEPFVDDLGDKVSGKKVALFGSYGWGSGEWMDEWASRMKSYGANLVTDPLIVNEFTTGKDEEICKQYGEKLGKL
jgi:flavodoxin short chain